MQNIANTNPISKQLQTSGTAVWFVWPVAPTEAFSMPHSTQATPYLLCPEEYIVLGP